MSTRPGTSKQSGYSSVLAARTEIPTPAATIRPPSIVTEPRDPAISMRSSVCGYVVVDASTMPNAPVLEADDPRFQGKSYYGASHPLVIEDFVAAVRDGRPPAVDGREGRKVLEVIFGIYESSRTGREVVLGGGVGGGK